MMMEARKQETSEQSLEVEKLLKPLQLRLVDRGPVWTRSQKRHIIKFYSDFCLTVFTASELKGHPTCL